MKYQFTAAEVEYLKANYPHRLTEDIAKEMNRTYYSVNYKAHKLGLRKTNAFFQSNWSGRINSATGSTTRFKKGSTPWNKGLSYIPVGCDKSWFQAGHKPWQTKQDGSITERVDAGRVYKYIRISECNWIPLHVKIWMDANGPVPEGYIVVFKNATLPDRERLDNLEMITRQENMERNRLTQWPPDLRETIKAVNKLKKAIKNEQKNHHE